MANAEKVVDYVSALLSGLIPPGPVGAAAKPAIKLVGDNLKAWLANKETQKALLEAARGAENDFRQRSKEQFGNDTLSQAVISFPLYNGDLFQAALQSLPSHLNETILETHLGDDLAKYWSREFIPEEIRAATALYLECLRIRLLGISGFREIVTGLAILRVDTRTENMEHTLDEINEKLSNLLDRNIAEVAPRSLHQLPPPPPDFTGREELIAQLLEDFHTHQGAAITARPTHLHALTGMGGIGKTALGLVVAHKIKDRYPDAQLFLDLKGTTSPLSVVEIVRYVLLSLEPGLDVRALNEENMRGAYLSALHGKRVLLFLDNARSAEQVAPLQSPESCAMLVTSRWTFPVPGLQNRRLDVLDEEDAEKLLLALCPRIANHAPALAHACAYLPLALRIVGSFLQVNDHWEVEKYIARLNDRKGRLEALHQDREEAELKTEPDLLAAFDLSYGRLSDENKKYWRILGVFPASFDARAAQAVWGLEEDAALKLLGLLRRYSLLEYNETSSRYSLHDLLADYACSVMAAGEEAPARIAHAVHYSGVLYSINQMFLQGGGNILPALRMYDTEWTNIEAGQKASVLELEQSREAAEACNWYAGQGSINHLRLRPRQQIKWIDGGLRAARILKNRKAEGAHLGNLGIAYKDLGETRKAIEYYEQALVIARETGDKRNEENWLGNLGNAYAALGETRKAIEYYEQALVIDREIGDRRGEGADLGNLGNAYADLGEARKAIEYYEQALVIDREIGDWRGEGADLGSLGIAYGNLGETRKAIEYYEGQLVIDREIGDRRGEGNALFNTGLALYKLEEKDRAIDLAQQALSIYEAIESPSAEKARSTLKEWGVLPVNGEDSQVQ